MKKENKMLMLEAREVLKGKWGNAVIGTLVFCVISGAASAIPFVSLVVSGPLAMGVAYYFLALSRGKTPVIEDLFKGFNYFLNTFVTFLLVSLFTLLWMLLLIIPGIVAAISYSQVFFILAEDPMLNSSAAIEKSKKMMYGYKWKYFCLGFRFIGWAILCIFTFGIGFLWLIPYMQVTLAKFHDDIKGDHPQVHHHTKAEEKHEVIEVVENKETTN
jgi:uncharacterized membrane protein